MFRLGQDPQLPQFFIQIRHVRRHPRLDHAEIVIVHLLTLGRLGTEQCTAGIDQILPLLIQFPGNQEILLLRAHAGADTFHIRISKQLQNPKSLPIQRLHGAQQRGFLVQGLTAVGTECCGDTQSLSLDKSVGSRIPGGVSPGFKSGAKAAGGEGAGIRLAPNQLLTGKVHDHAAIRGGRDKAVVLLRRDSRQGLEPVGKVGSPPGHRPVLHCRRHRIGNGKIQLRTMVNGVPQRLVHVCA